MKNELKWYQCLLALILFVVGLTLVGIDNLFGKKEGEEDDG